jgi:hypothetical protein
MSRDRYLDADDCPPHVRWVYCEACNEYTELAGVVCHDPSHTGQAACASVPLCPRCEPTELPAVDPSPRPGACQGCGNVFFHAPDCSTPEERAEGAAERWVDGADPENRRTA